MSKQAQTSSDYLRVALEHLEIAVQAATSEIESERKGHHGARYPALEDAAIQRQSVAMVARNSLKRDLEILEAQTSRSPYW